MKVRGIRGIMKKPIVAIFGIGILFYPLICFSSYKDFQPTTKGLDAVALNNQAVKLLKGGEYTLLENIVPGTETGTAERKQEKIWKRHNQQTY